MPEKATPAKPVAENTFVPVHVLARHRGSVLRNPPGCTLVPSGASVLNRAATGQIKDLANEGKLDPGSFNVRFGANEAAGTIAVYVCAAETADSKMVHRHKKGNMTIYLHDVFDQFPALRPSMRHKCSAALSTDSNGNRCLVLNVNASLPKRAARAQKSTKTNPTQVKPK